MEIIISQSLEVTGLCGGLNMMHFKQDLLHTVWSVATCQKRQEYPSAGHLDTCPQPPHSRVCLQAPGTAPRCHCDLSRMLSIEILKEDYNSGLFSRNTNQISLLGGNGRQCDPANAQHQLFKLAPAVARGEMQVGRKALKWLTHLIATVTVMILKMVEFLLIALESI